METKVLMVCLGNICRSPLAEGLLKEKVNPEKIKVDSAGTSNHHQGEKPDVRSIDVAQKNGINIKDQRARQFTRKDFDTFDYIFVMDNSNYQNVTKLAQTPAQKEKVHLILNWLSEEKLNLEVPDPYFGGAKGFDNVYRMLDTATTNIAHYLETV
ncbi:MAG: low molecular weight protein-tyrosine-phosphatase [Mesonia hippocampi]|uniref:low molecular weight protein-tyrosine-phosphatase n=1 Tax=Mesonia hippocampi TaxID=1628250 RepID=UPI003F9EAAB8